jgi:hypothetical protein
MDASNRPSTEFENPDAVPYFLWDEPMTMRELREALATRSEPERLRLIAKILREARDTEVWLFTTPKAIAKDWQRLAPRLGRRKAFWEFLLTAWRHEGLLVDEPTH